eukprot:scaffold38025_cov25-Tisochrysis_lutea.AAC.5
MLSTTTTRYRSACEHHVHAQRPAHLQQLRLPQHRHGQPAERDARRRRSLPVASLHVVTRLARPKVPSPPCRPLQTVAVRPHQQQIPRTGVEQEAVAADLLLAGASSYMC